MKVHPGDVAWALIAGYEVLCPRDEMLCHAIDRRILRNRILTRAAVLYVALHAADLLDPRFDLFTQARRLLKTADTSPRVELGALLGRCRPLTRAVDCSCGSDELSGSQCASQLSSSRR